MYHRHLTYKASNYSNRLLLFPFSFFFFFFLLFFSPLPFLFHRNFFQPFFLYCRFFIYCSPPSPTPFSSTFTSLSLSSSILSLLLSSLFLSVFSPFPPSSFLYHPLLPLFPFAPSFLPSILLLFFNSFLHIARFSSISHFFHLVNRLSFDPL